MIFRALWFLILIVILSGAELRGQTPFYQDKTITRDSRRTAGGFGGLAHARGGQHFRVNIFRAILHHHAVYGRGRRPAGGESCLSTSRNRTG